MTRTASRAALLHVAVEDLRAGKALLAERLPALSEAASDRELVALLRGEAERAGRQRDRIDAAGSFAAGPKNLWMIGILDDADRDARSHQPGALLDIALVGAVRKAKAAEIVSHETALALVEAVGALAEVLANLRDEDAATDHALRARLIALS